MGISLEDSGCVSCGSYFRWSRASRLLAVCVRIQSPPGVARLPPPPDSSPAAHIRLRVVCEILKFNQNSVNPDSQQAIMPTPTRTSVIIVNSLDIHPCHVQRSTLGIMMLINDALPSPASFSILILIACSGQLCHVFVSTPSMAAASAAAAVADLKLACKLHFRLPFTSDALLPWTVKGATSQR